jgi:hypothetical protein
MLRLAVQRTTVCLSKSVHVYIRLSVFLEFFSCSPPTDRSNCPDSGPSRNETFASFHPFASIMASAGVATQTSARAPPTQTQRRAAISPAPPPPPPPHANGHLSSAGASCCFLFHFSAFSPPPSHLPHPLVLFCQFFTQFAPVASWAITLGSSFNSNGHPLLIPCPCPPLSENPERGRLLIGDNAMSLATSCVFSLSRYGFRIARGCAWLLFLQASTREETEETDPLCTSTYTYIHELQRQTKLR